jgi:hypothetical protein
MKLSISLSKFRAFVILFVFTLVQTAGWAQDNGSSGSSTTTTTTHSASNQQSDWYSSPWVWVIGAAVLILLIVALSSGRRSDSGRSDKVTVTKTVRRDTDTDAV